MLWLLVGLGLGALLVPACCVRRILGIQIFLLRISTTRRDIARPGSGSVQSLLRICSGWLTIAHPNYHYSTGGGFLTELMSSIGFQV
jgi:hypothetical protein